MKPELLAPAGNLEKLKWAVKYGCDAVYFGCQFGSLRSFAGNFTFQQAEEGLKFLHDNGKKGYITLNIYPFTEEYNQLLETAKTLDSMGADGFIVSDLGVLAELKKQNIKAELHISTQANTVSAQAALQYGCLGAKRVNLARELSLEQVCEIQKQTKGKIDTEVFVHGSVCFSYSGRCAISDYLTGFRANHGECKHPCRWKYRLVEEQRPGEYIRVAEDDRGLYLFNSKELALFRFIDDLIDAGVSALKIEGRMKSIHYIASIVSLYRQIIDGKNIPEQTILELLSRVSNRGYSEGFMKGKITCDDYDIDKSDCCEGAVFAANVTEDSTSKKCILEVRNKIAAGETLEALTPDGKLTNITLPDPLELTTQQRCRHANNSQFVLLKAPPACLHDP